MLKSPRITRGVPSSGKDESSTSSSSKKLPSLPGGRYTTTKWILIGLVMVIECDLNELLSNGGAKVTNFQAFEMSRPVPPPLPVRRGVCEKVKLVERAAGVTMSSALIHVSVRANRLRPE